MNKPAVQLVSHEDVDLGELGSSIGFLLRMAQLNVFEAYYENLGQHGLKPGEFSVLWVIGLNPGLKQGALARRLSIKAAHMTKLVQRLVKAGLVKRRSGEQDRRAVHLTLSAKGGAFVARHKQELLAFHKSESGRLSTGETEQLRKLLRKLTAVAE